MTRSRALLIWALVGVPVALFSFIIWANATVEPGQPPAQGWRWPFYWTFFGLLLLSGIVAVAMAATRRGRSWVVAISYAAFMAFFLFIGGAIVSMLCGDIG